jgi:hypothetical protein
MSAVFVFTGGLSMSHEAVALLFWSMLAVSIALTIAGVGTHTSGVLFVAAAFSLVCGLAAIFSIGIFILALALIQISLGLAFRRQSSSA